MFKKIIIVSIVLLFNLQIFPSQNVVRLQEILNRSKFLSADITRENLYEQIQQLDDSMIAPKNRYTVSACKTAEAQIDQIIERSFGRKGLRLLEHINVDYVGQEYCEYFYKAFLRCCHTDREVERICAQKNFEYKLRSAYIVIAQLGKFPESESMQRYY